MSDFIKMNRKDIQKELDKETPLDLDKVLIGLDSIYNYGQKIVEKFKSIETVEDFLKIQKSMEMIIQYNIDSFSIEISWSKESKLRNICGFCHKVDGTLDKISREVPKFLYNSDKA